MKNIFFLFSIVSLSGSLQAAQQPTTAREVIQRVQFLTDNQPKDLSTRTKIENAFRQGENKLTPADLALLAATHQYLCSISEARKKRSKNTDTIKTELTPHLPLKAQLDFSVVKGQFAHCVRLLEQKTK